MTVALLAITYASDVWYIPPYKTAHVHNLSGSVSATKSLCLVQGITTCYITGSIKGTTFDILEVQTYSSKGPNFKQPCESVHFHHTTPSTL